MKNDLFSADGPELKSPELKDVDTDHSEDSDLLDMIGRDSVNSEVTSGNPKSTKRQIVSSSPFLLESLYFQSFGERRTLDERRRDGTGETDRSRIEYHPSDIASCPSPAVSRETIG